MSFPNTVKSLVETGVFMSLGARNFRTDPEASTLIFDATVLPFRKDGTRSERPRKMQVQVGVSESRDGGLSVAVGYADKDVPKVHCAVDYVAITDLNKTLLAIDYDGDEALNPEYV